MKLALITLLSLAFSLNSYAASPRQIKGCSVQDMSKDQIDLWSPSKSSCVSEDEVKKNFVEYLLVCGIEDWIELPKEYKELGQMKRMKDSEGDDIQVYHFQFNNQEALSHIIDKYYYEGKGATYMGGGYFNSHDLVSSCSGKVYNIRN